MFVRELGLTPHACIEGTRINHARYLLEATGLALKAIAFDSGFASTDHMRIAIQRKLGVKPNRYRENFAVC